MPVSSATGQAGGRRAVLAVRATQWSGSRSEPVVEPALGSAGVSVVTGGVLCLVSLGLLAWRYRVLRSAVFVDGVVSDLDGTPVPATSDRPA